MPASFTRQSSTFTRRGLVQAGAISALGLGMAELNALATNTTNPRKPAKSVIFVFAIGGMSQLETFDLKPNAPADVRGEFRPIATRTPGLQVCEHLPLLAARGNHFSLVRSVSHSYTDHRQGAIVMQTGQSTLPPGFAFAARRTDWPSVPALAGYATKPRSLLPKAIVLPEYTYHNVTGLVPGQTGGLLGANHDPWLLQAAGKCNATGYDTRGCCPDCFDFLGYPGNHRCSANPLFEPPRLGLTAGITQDRLDDRDKLLAEIDRQRRDLDSSAAVASLDAQRQRVASLLTDRATRDAFDLSRVPAATLDRFGRNKFGWSLLLASRLVAAGVNVVQVNLGHNFTWDTHEAIFPVLKDRLLPPADRGLAALLDDLHDTGRLDDTLVVLASEFGREPRIYRTPADKTGQPGRNHWGQVQSVLFAGGGVQGGRIIGASDKNGGYPGVDRKTPEDFAATIYHILGIPPTAEWHDRQNRPHSLYQGQPITKLL